MPNILRMIGECWLALSVLQRLKAQVHTGTSFCNTGAWNGLKGCVSTIATCKLQWCVCSELLASHPCFPLASLPFKMPLPNFLNMRCPLPLPLPSARPLPLPSCWARCPGRATQPTSPAISCSASPLASWRHVSCALRVYKVGQQNAFCSANWLLDHLCSFTKSTIYRLYLDPKPYNSIRQ